jgi:hypothetical protein
MDPIVTDPNAPNVLPDQQPTQPAADTTPPPADTGQAGNGQDKFQAEWAKMSPEAQQHIAQAIFEQGQISAMQHAQEQGLLMDPNRPKEPTQPKSPMSPEENPFLKNFERQMGEVLGEIEKLPPQTATVLKKALSMTLHEAVKGSAGVNQQLTADQMQQIMAPYNEFMIEQRKGQFYNQNPHMNGMKDRLEQALSRKDVNAWEIAALVSDGIKQGIDSFRQEYEARLQSEPDVYGGYLEATRGRITPQAMAGIKQLEDAALAAAEKGDPAALSAALRKRWEQLPPG